MFCGGGAGVLVEDVTNGLEKTGPIAVVNDVDHEGPPLFTYTTCYVDSTGQPITLPPPPARFGCRCTDKCRYTHAPSHSPGLAKVWVTLTLALTPTPTPNATPPYPFAIRARRSLSLLLKKQ